MKELDDKIINFKEQRLKKMMEQYKEELQTHYVISKRIQEESDIPMELYTDQYDLYHGKTCEPYMALIIIPKLATLSITYTHSDIKCALVLEPNLSKAELINISIEEVEDRIEYIQLAVNALYANDLEFMTPLSKVKESPHYEEYFRFSGYSVWSSMYRGIGYVIIVLG